MDDFHADDRFDPSAPVCEADHDFVAAPRPGNYDDQDATAFAPVEKAHDEPARNDEPLVNGGPARDDESARDDGPADEAESFADESAAELAPPPSSRVPMRVVEALLFAADAPLSANKLAELVGAGTQTEVRLAIASLNDQYRELGMSFRIEEIARGYQMMTLPEYRPWLAKLNRQRSETRLSDAALETLAIVAYKQPIIRADIESIRGVACGDSLNKLRDLGLVRIVGRADVVGRPMLYGTTRKFLDLFGLADLDDLPPMEALKLRPVRREAPPAEHQAAAGA